MKRIITLSICLLLIVVSLTSCADLLSDLYKTNDYKRFRNFSQNYKVGMDKQDVFEKLGYPESSAGDDGKKSYYDYGYENREAYKEIIMSSNSVRWFYSCYELPDPANPYFLLVYFDSEGKCTDVKFEVVKGG